MKKSPKKIVLAKETLRNLTEIEATAAPGGVSIPVCSKTCAPTLCSIVC